MAQRGARRVPGTARRRAVGIAAGAFSALTCLIGAKGLIRSKRLEDHAFGEYFLIGTLASAALAIAGGLMVGPIVAALW